MSRLEQMRESFLRKIYNEQFQEYSLLSDQHHRNLSSPTSRMIAKSTINIPSSLRRTSSSSLWQTPQQQSQFQDQKTTRTKTNHHGRLQPTLSSGTNNTRHGYYRQTATTTARVTISRVRSLNNVSTLTQHHAPLFSIQQESTILLNNNNKNSMMINRNSSQTTYFKQQQQRPLTAAYLNNSVNNNSQYNNNHGTKVNNSANHKSIPAQRSQNSTSEENKRTVTTTTTTSTNNSQTKNSLQCKHCNRKFSAKDRLDKHMNICAKIFLKHRPIFQSAKQRQLESQTDNQQLKPTTNESILSDSQKPLTMKPANTNQSSNKDKPSNWKENRQRFLQSIKQERLKNLSKQNEENIEFLIDFGDKTDVNGTLLSNNANSPSSNMIECTHCKKKFHSEVILKHETFCELTI